MGDRVQIAVKQDKGKMVYLYSHWDGKGAFRKLQTALKRKQRWDDPEYLARIIFSELIKGHEQEETGYGIGTSAHSDVEHPIPVLDCDQKVITWEGTDQEPPCSFEEFCNQRV